MIDRLSVNHTLSHILLPGYSDIYEKKLFLQILQTTALRDLRETNTMMVMALSAVKLSTTTRQTFSKIAYCPLKLDNF